LRKVDKVLALLIKGAYNQNIESKTYLKRSFKMATAKFSSPTTIEALRQLRFSIEALTAASSAACAAQTQMRASGQTPAIDLAAAVRSELKIASRRFNEAFTGESEALNEDAARHLHAAVWK
jgi:hypothetical protein